MPVTGTRRAESYPGGILVVYTDEEHWRKDLKKHDKATNRCQMWFVRVNHWEPDVFRLFKDVTPGDYGSALEEIGCTINEHVWVTMRQGDFIALSMLLCG